MANVVHGKDAYVEVYSDVAADWVYFTCADGMTLNIEPELVNITTVGLGRGYGFKTRRIGWSLNLTGVSDIDSDGRTVFTSITPATVIQSQQIRITYEDLLGNTAVITGYVLLEAASIAALAEGFADFDMNFRGIGVYELVQTIDGVIPPGGSGFGFLLEVGGDQILQETGDEILLENG